MRYVRAKCAADDEEYAYRAWMTETLRLQHENKYLAARWTDIVDHTPPPPERSGDEIALSVIAGAGLKLRG